MVCVVSTKKYTLNSHEQEYSNQDFIAHSEPLCKLLNVLKVSDLFVCSLWKFYYKLIKK